MADEAGVPRRAVCLRVLNLLSQVGIRPKASALPIEGYRIHLREPRSPYVWCWLKTVGWHHAHGRELHLYHSTISANAQVPQLGFGHEFRRPETRVLGEKMFLNTFPFLI